jgi:DeoR family transcriptional regulator of aga operon/DeoR family fructose operon transcriptional repressor
MVGVTSDPGGGGVFAEERQDNIARIVEGHGRARVTDLAAQFGVSGVTIRKDLAALEMQGRLVRTHGGAMAAGRARSERAFDVRERLQSEEKEAIGRAAAAMVFDGEAIALDASTTALAMARRIRSRSDWLNLTVITNGLRIAEELAGHRGISVAMPAGFLRWEAMSLVGPLSEGLFEKVNIQTAFVGAAGFSIDAGLSDATEEEAQIKRLMVTAATEVVAVVDHTKWQRAAFATFCPTARISSVVSAAAAPAGMAAELRQRGIRIQLVEPAPRAPRSTGGSRTAPRGLAE